MIDAASARMAQNVVEMAAQWSRGRESRLRGPEA